MKLKYVCMSNIGKLRRTNQDNFVVPNHECADTLHDTTEMIFGETEDNGAALAVFDGIGGLAKGEVASSLAAKSMKDFTEKKCMRKEDYNDLCLLMNEKICQYMKLHKISSMGTTFSSLLFRDREVTVCNIGDSPIFYVNSGSMKKLSLDHTGFGGSVKPGLTQYLGIPTEEFVIEPFIKSSKLQAGDRYLICSDGITDMVSRIDIMDILSEKNIERAASKLTDAALENGGRDNLTLILIDVN